MTASFASFDPATGDLLWEGPAASGSDCARAVAAARAALPAWSGATPDARIGILRRYAELLGERRSVIAEAIARETGKPYWEATSEAGAMIGKVAISITAMDERAARRESKTPFGQARLEHRPHGVMAVLGPYNFPGHLPNGHIVPALLAGNTLLFKPSEETPLVGQLLVETLHAAGVPEDAAILVQGGRGTGAALVAQDIDGLLFTGSAAAGAHFRRLFADRPSVIVALELGGNNPLIAWDGGPAAVASIIVASAFITAGQRCSCTRRLIVPAGSTGDAIVEAVVALSDRLRIGAWQDEPEPFMGPLISGGAAKRAAAQVKNLVGLGARVLRAPGSVAGRSAAFMRPAILDVTGLEVPDEEIFAPVLQIVRAGNFDEAVAAANATRFGLSAGLISDDDELWKRFWTGSRAGVVNRNRPTTGASSDMPFGGIGESGNHRPSAYYAADYCAYPVASLEALRVASQLADLKGVEE
jgi:succinylglutamic semialdehyde dehydrogenase